MLLQAFRFTTVEVPLSSPVRDQNPGKRRLLVGYGITTAMLCGACQVASPSKSAFLSRFSGAESIKRSYEHTASHGRLSISESEVSTVLGNRHLRHRADRAELIIGESDELSFLQRIKEDIEQQIQLTGGKIVDQGSGKTTYSISYTSSNVIGWIDVWGMQGTADNYKVTILITESQESL